MRRVLGYIISCALISQIGGVPLAGAATTGKVVSANSVTLPPKPTPHATPPAVTRPAIANYRDPSRYAHLVAKPRGRVRPQRAARPMDLVKLRRATRRRHAATRNAALPAQTTGIWPWWTYEARDIPGIGQAMVNVGTLNMLVETNDVDIPAGGLDVAFRRMYNSQSQHDANNDDNSTPSVFGNRWTNTLDVHLGWVSTGQNTGTVSVYTADGARDDYSCQTNVVATCTPLTTGIYDILATVHVSGGICEYQWTKKSGTSYVFNAPYAACGNGAGQYGRLLTIYARNSLFYVQLAYSWSPNASSPENLTQIVATHEPDGTSLTLNFGQIAGTSITELMSLVRPDSEVLDYQYSSTGELTGVDKPANNPILVGETLPTQWPNGAPIPAGNVPELYDVNSTSLSEVCGPRAAIAILGNYMTDGACADFDYSGASLADWWTRGVLNPTPQDGVGTPSPIQGNEKTGFVTWDTTSFTAYVTTNCPPLSSGATELSDVYSHDTVWCYDASDRVNQTTSEASATDSLTTSQKWDANNNPIETTDARGFKTDMAYDGNGNTLEVSLPSQATSIGTIRPTSLYDYDAYNNVINYCDPANNPNNGWQPSPSPSPCANSGATNYAKFIYSSDPQQTPDANEPYGCLTDTYPPSGYHTSISYSGTNGHPCNNGLPTQTQGTQISQKDGSNRTPTQTFGYGPAGNLTSYNAGNGAWALSYTGDGMNRLRSRTDPDGVTSRWCYNLDGSVFYSETAHQYQLDGTPSKCPTNAQLAAGTATPPPYAVSYGYDADGDVATETHHHNCTASACAANTSLTSWCTPSVAIAAGTTCKYYDGLDRLVEVKQPYDTVNDIYVNPWMTRYLYDLTGAQINWQGQSFYAYGNLFKTQEMLPNNPTVTVTTLSAGSIANPSYTAIKATAFDGLDRAITKYSFVNVNGTEDLNTETLTWDTSPISGSNVVGFLGEDCNDLSQQQCQEFDYFPDGQEKTFESSDGSSPKRTYQYDPDGRATSITSATYSTAQQYTYGVDGHLVTATDPSDSSLSSPATVTHTYYADGVEERLDVSSAALTQTGLFTYSYRNDARISTYTIDDTGLGSAIKNPGKTSISYTYTSAGRLTNRSESGAAAYGTPTTIGYDLPNSGFETSETIPSGTSLSQFSYSAESELLAVQASGSEPCNSANFTYSLRGELVNWPDCTNYYGAHAFMANGASLQPGQPPRQQYTWDNLMAVALVNEAWCSPTCNTWSWNYDAAGRMNLESGPVGGVGVGTTRCYDAENHVTATIVISGSCGSQTTGAVSEWGPNGHPITVGTYDGSGNLHNETLHWNGAQVLFATRKVNGSVTLDDVKVDVQGDILPNDGGYNGLTFYDRAPGGVAMGCHNAGGANFAGFADSWGRNFHAGTAWSTPCLLNAATAMPTSIQWYGTYYTNAPGTPAIGQGGSLGMPRRDGLTDGYDTIQGVRTYDSNAGSWTTPDAYEGDIHDPRTQKAFMWNDNNPIQWSDPSGYCVGPLVLLCIYAPEITAIGIGILDAIAGTGPTGPAGVATREIAPSLEEFKNIRAIGGFPDYLKAENLGFQVFNSDLKGAALQAANRQWVKEGIEARQYFLLTPGRYGAGTQAEIDQLLKAGYTPIVKDGQIIGFQPPPLTPAPAPAPPPSQPKKQ